MTALSIHEMLTHLNNTDDVRNQPLFSSLLFPFVGVKLLAQPPYFKGTTQLTLVNSHNLSQYENLRSLYCVVCPSSQ